MTTSPQGKIKALGAATAAATAQAAGLVKAITPQRALDAVRALQAARRRPEPAPGASPGASLAGSVQLRRGDRADLPALAALHQASGLACDPAPDLARLADHWEALAAAGAEVWLAERDGELLGALTLYLLPLLARGGSRAAWVDDLAVHPGAHHLGIPRRLIALATQQARAAGACKLALSPRQRPGKGAAAAPGRGFMERLAYSRHGRQLDLPPTADGAV